MLDQVIADFILRHAQPLLTCAGPAPRIGAELAQVPSIDDGALAAREGRLLFVGPTEVCDRLVEQAPGALVVDATGCTVLPGFVDAHTHAVFAGDRRDELRRRLGGATYAEIAAAGGGILKTVQATRAASVDELVEASRPRLAEMLRAGTTTAEVKSGYGLTTESELAMLRAIARLAAEQPIELAATFMGAHEVPPEFRDNRDGYVRLLVDEMIPAVTAERLAEWNDVFCERGVFTPDEAQQILDAGRRAGLMPRIHANELGETGGAQVAALVGARSADHLVFVSDADIVRAGPGRGGRDPAAGGVVLSQAGTLCAGPAPDRRRRAGGPGDRRQPGRGVLALDALHDDPGVLRDGADV